MAKQKKLNTNLDLNREEDDSLAVNDEVIVEEAEGVVEEDDSSYTMGTMIIDDGSVDEVDPDLAILNAGKKANGDEEDEDSDNDNDVWVGDIDSVLDMSDDILDNADYDPEEDYYEKD